VRARAKPQVTNRNRDRKPELIQSGLGVLSRLPANSFGSVNASTGDLGTCPVRWLEARDQTRAQLEHRKSVCLHVVNEKANWRALVSYPVGAE
jgi:hypothetical protein